MEIGNSQKQSIRLVSIRKMFKKIKHKKKILFVLFKVYPQWLRYSKPKFQKSDLIALLVAEKSRLNPNMRSKTVVSMISIDVQCSRIIEAKSKNFDEMHTKPIPWKWKIFKRLVTDLSLPYRFKLDL